MSTASSSPAGRSRARACRCCCERGRRSARRTGLRLTVAGADPLAVRLLLARLRVSDEGIDVVGFLSQEELTATLLRAKALIAPSIGRRASAWSSRALSPVPSPWSRRTSPATERYSTPEAAVAVPPNDTAALVDAVCGLVGDEAERERMGEPARSLAVERYSWPTIARRLERIYEAVTGVEGRGAGRVRTVARLWRSGWTQARRDRRAVPRVRRHLVARARVGRGPGGLPLVIWSWIVLAFFLNVISTLFRALSWRLTVGQALPPSTSRRSCTSSPPSASDCSRTRSSLAASASSRASATLRVISPTRRRARARRSWARSSRTGSSTSSRRRFSSSGCSSRPRCRTGRSSRS